MLTLLTLLAESDSLCIILKFQTLSFCKASHRDLSLEFSNLQLDEIQGT